LYTTRKNEDYQHIVFFIKKLLSDIIYLVFLFSFMDKEAWRKIKNVRAEQNKNISAFISSGMYRNNSG
jgi:hypothetical protein